MKILHLDSGREMRGGQWQVLLLHQALLEAGHASFLLARDGGPLLAMAKERGLPCDSLHGLRVLGRSQNFDIVHAHDARSHSLAALLSRSPFVVSRRVTFPVKTSALSRKKYQTAKRYLAVSRFVAGVLADADIDHSCIDIVYDGVEIPAEPAHGETMIAPYTTDPAKGMALAEEAAKLSGVAIRFSRDLDKDLPSSRAMIYLTQAEGLGSGILLAMAYGVPAIASRIGGIPELIEDGVNGVLVQNEPHSIARAIRSLNSACCEELGRNARETVRNRFTVEHMVEATLASYRKAMND